MKKSILAMGATTFIIAAIVTSCNTGSQKLKNAEENVMEANKDLDKANEDYLNDVEEYKVLTAEKIKANNEAIADFKLKIENEKKDVKEDHNRKLQELEQKNIELKKSLGEYKLEGKEKWEIFKAEFNHDMDELGKAFNDLSIKNTN